MFDKMKQLMEMKKQADTLKKQLESETIECEEIKGLKITMDGAQKVLSISVSDEYYQKKSKQDLERELVRSLNEASKKVQKVAAQKLAGAMPGIV